MILKHKAVAVYWALGVTECILQCDRHGHKTKCPVGSCVSHAGWHASHDFAPSWCRVLSLRRAPSTPSSSPATSAVSPCRLLRCFLAPLLHIPRTKLPPFQAVSCHAPVFSLQARLMVNDDLQVLKSVVHEICLLQVYKKMCMKGIEATDTTYTALISAYAKAERLEDALATYKIMARTPFCLLPRCMCVCGCVCSEGAWVFAWHTAACWCLHAWHASCAPQATLNSCGLGIMRRCCADQRGAPAQRDHVHKPGVRRGEGGAVAAGAGAVPPRRRGRRGAQRRHLQRRHVRLRARCLLDPKMQC